MRSALRRLRNKADACFFGSLFLVVAGLLGLQSCSGGGSDSSPPPPAPAVNSVPVGHAGLDQIALSGSNVTLFGGRSADADNDTLTFAWSFLSVPAASQATIDGSGEVVSFVADEVGDYVVELVVSDAEADGDPVQITTTVIADRNLLAEGTSLGQWPSYSGDLSSSKYSPLDQISADNIDELAVAWRWAPGTSSGYQFEATPLFVDNTLYLSTSMNQVAALDAATGEELWVFDTGAATSGRPANNGFLHRGVSYDESTGNKVIYMPTNDGRLIALNAISGQPIAGFGTIGNGSINTLAGVPRLNATSQALSDAHDAGASVSNGETVQLQISHTSPGTICRNVFVLGAGIHDGELAPPSPPGDVRGYDLSTGALVWEFHTVPRAGEFGFDSWQDDSALLNGAANVWAPMSADEALGLVYLPVSGGTNNYYGGNRLGDNLFTDSIVALNCETGERAWHYQTIHHDIWDYDLPAAPNLLDITVDGVPINALAQVSKQGFVYVLDRRTGVPVWPIPETPVAASDAPGEVAALTQPIPSRPPPFARQGVDPNELINPLSVGSRKTGPLYTPPSEDGLLATPGIGGGANWGGAAYDPTTQVLYTAGFGPLTSDLDLDTFFFNGMSVLFSNAETFFGPTTASPFPGFGSTVTAYDMAVGEILYQVPGTSNSELIGNSASLIAGNLLYYKNNGTTVMGVLDKTTGMLLREVPLGGARLTGVPMTYLLNDRQYVVVALGNTGEMPELVALALPE